MTHQNPELRKERSIPCGAPGTGRSCNLSALLRMEVVQGGNSSCREKQKVSLRLVSLRVVSGSSACITEEPCLF